MQKDMEMHIRLCSSDNCVLSSPLSQHCVYFLEEKLIRVNMFLYKTTVQ